MPHAVRCPSCREPVGVEDVDVGRVVACPRCGRPFVADAPPDHPDAPAPNDALSPPLVGLALLPWGIPILWVVAWVVTGTAPLFTFALPVALAVGLSALGIGLGMAAGWGFATKAKGIVALALVGYFVAGGLFFVKREWAEALRQKVGRNKTEWHEFKPAGPQPPYRIELPAPAKPTDTPLPGWNLNAFLAIEEEPAAVDRFVVAHGKPPANLPAEPAAWFERAKDALTEATGGEVETDAEVAGPAGFAARQFVLLLPDGTPRVVRLFRGPDAAFYLAAEGPFLTPDALDVRRFFRSFKVTPRK